MLIFGAGAAGGWGNNPLINMAIVFAIIYLFLKFCGWAKGFSVSSGVKKVIFLLTVVALGFMNYQYVKGNDAITAAGDWGVATLAVSISLVWVFIFTFALVAQTKTTDNNKDKE